LTRTLAVVLDHFGPKGRTHGRYFHGDVEDCKRGGGRRAPAGPFAAEQQTLKFRLVTKQVSGDTLQVANVEGRSVGAGRYVCVAVFEDGRRQPTPSTPRGRGE
jgi:hypothetical protein